MASRKKLFSVEELSILKDMFGGEDDKNEDIIENTIIEENPESPPAPKQLAPRNKVKKAVEKTYEDEEGFIVTRTEYVYETASEDETEETKIPVKPSPKPAVKEKKSSSTSENDTSPKNKAAKGKKGKKAPAANQPSIMSFFKKK